MIEGPVASFIGKNLGLLTVFRMTRCTFLLPAGFMSQKTSQITGCDTTELRAGDRLDESSESNLRNPTERYHLPLFSAFSLFDVYFIVSVDAST